MSTRSPSRTPTLAELINRATESRAAELRVALPAKVERYDAATQTIDAKPLIKSSALEEDGTITVDPLPVIPNVPVVFPGAGGFRLTFPIQAGDTVLLVFADRSLDVWLSQGGDVDPRDVRTHHLADAIAIPGLHPSATAWTGASSSAATVGKDGGPQIVFEDGAIHLGAADGDPATESVVLGDAYRGGESAMLAGPSGLATQFATIAEAFASIQLALGALGTAVTAASKGLLIPPAGVALNAAVAAFVLTASKGCASGILAANTAAFGIGEFEAKAETFLSQKVKTK